MDEDEPQDAASAAAAILALSSGGAPVTPSLAPSPSVEYEIPVEMHEDAQTPKADAQTPKGGRKKGGRGRAYLPGSECGPLHGVFLSSFFCGCCASDCWRCVDRSGFAPPFVLACASLWR